MCSKMQCLYIQDAVLLNLHCQELPSKMAFLEKGVLKSKCYKKRIGTFAQWVSTDINQILIFPYWPNKAADCYRLYQLSRKEEGPASDIIVLTNCWHFSEISDHKQVYQSLFSVIKAYFRVSNLMLPCDASLRYPMHAGDVYFPFYRTMWHTRWWSNSTNSQSVQSVQVKRN